MRAYQEERLMNAVCYFAIEHSKRTGKPAFQTYIYKYLSLFDFRMLEINGVPALDIEYKAMEMGPVPADLYNNKKETEKYRFLRVKNNDVTERWLVVPISAPDLDYFSEEELEEMNRLLDEFANPEFNTTNKLIEATHKRIQAWKVAWAKRGIWKSYPMKYEDTFMNEENSFSAIRFRLFEGIKNNAGRRCDPVGEF